MNNKELSTEQIILEAAEAEFLEKGYAGTKMMAIAKRANVAHSMLHYYFRSKENLFQMIFLKKAQLLLPLFESALEQRLPFLEAVQILIKTQFDFLAKNPRLPFFIISEIIANKENRTLLLEVIAPKATSFVLRFKGMFEKEVKKGVIRPIEFQDFILNFLALNLSTFIAMPVAQDMMTPNPEQLDKMLNERRESNVQFILAALKP